MNIGYTVIGGGNNAQQYYAECKGKLRGRNKRK